MIISDFFQLGPLPANQMTGSYDLRLVLVSYLVATFASYVALDTAGRLRDVDNTRLSTALWVTGGALAMGLGIWSMHFIGMLAFKMNMMMHYDVRLTVLSMLVAFGASFFALLLLKTHKKLHMKLFTGGILMGFAIALMHYLGMAAMESNMVIRYKPLLFVVSILIALLASEAALWLAIKSNQGPVKRRVYLKIASAIVMGVAICGMHYTGMAAAVFTPTAHAHYSHSLVSPEYLSVIVATTAFFILSLAFLTSSYKEMRNHHAILIAHQKGMAEVASHVLHNVGNVLNSINVSATHIKESIALSEMEGLSELSHLLQHHQKDFTQFVATEAGSKIPEFIDMLAVSWQQEREQLSKEANKLINNLAHVKNIISMQQSLSIAPSMTQEVHIEDIINDSVSIVQTDTNRSLLTIKKDIQSYGPILVDKIKLMQIIINLLRNAKDSLLEANNSNKILSITSHFADDEQIIIKISDNGLGISPEHLKKIFTSGFTTKKEGHGFGLHASAIAANEMKGVIKVESNGVGKGATFILQLPYKTLSKSLFDLKKT